MQDQENSILKKLKNYLDETPQEQIKKDWDSCAKFDNVGMKVGDFLKVCEYNIEYLENKRSTELGVPKEYFGESKLDLNELESKLDNQLNKETEETLNNWLKNKRNKK